MGTLNLDRIPKASKPRRSRRHGKVAQRGSATLLAALAFGTASLAAALAPIVHALSGALAPLGH